MFVAFSGLDDAIFLYPLYALLFADSGLSTGEISVLLSLWAGAAFVLEVPSGVLADRLSRRHLLAVGAVLRAAGFALWICLPSFPAFAVGFLLWSAQGALKSGTLQALVYDELAAVGAACTYDRLLGRAAAAEGAAGLAATALAAPFFAFGGYQVVGWASVAMGLAQVPVALAFPGVPRTGVESEPTGIRVYVATLRAGVAEAVRDRAVRRLTLLTGLLPGLVAFDEYLPLLARAVGVPDLYVPLLMVVPGLAMVAAAALVAARRWRYAVAPVALAVAGFLVGAGAAATSTIGVVAIGVGIGAFHLARLLLDARLQHAISGPARATVTSLSGVLSEGAALAVFAAFGAGSVWLPMGWLFAADGLLVALGAAYVTADVVRRRRARDPAPVRRNPRRTRPRRSRRPLGRLRRRAGEGPTR
ncbi:MFS transporter [Actinopolymorpha singaporensis]|uniref:Predicted arabinose efflux permease, MFS family n=1 Tax=Actinopolymorpha singaporensis TaxID=117157 RepID=A0A1H1S601_9ACTN|nr:MFS transporter [Actinopolymorpha singaporensis]SDS43382.1 Predicted arabinose efflux permease, MFS family [Actinopolymorpha singaporensis]